MSDSIVIWDHVFWTVRADILSLTCAAKAIQFHGLDLQRELHVDYCTLNTFILRTWRTLTLLTVRDCLYWQLVFQSAYVPLKVRFVSDVSHSYVPRHTHRKGCHFSPAKILIPQVIKNDIFMLMLLLCYILLTLSSQQVSHQ